MATKPKPRTAAPQSNVHPIVAEMSKGGGNPSFSGGGGGQSGWEASVEARLGELRTDARNLLIAGIIAVVLLVGAAWTVYTSTTNQIQNLAVAQQTTAGKIDTLDAKISGKIDAIGAKIDDNSERSSRSGPDGGIYRPRESQAGGR